MEMDEDRNLPLRIAVTAASHLAPMAAVLDHNNNKNNNNVSGDHCVMSDAAMTFLSSATVFQTTNPFEMVLKMQLQQYLDAA
jgi:hypothetical protein